jgi:hypothetical protein
MIEVWNKVHKSDSTFFGQEPSWLPLPGSPATVATVPSMSVNHMSTNQGFWSTNGYIFLENNGGFPQQFRSSFSRIHS